jgi:hypothetical protein
MSARPDRGIAFLVCEGAAPAAWRGHAPTGIGFGLVATGVTSGRGHAKGEGEDSDCTHGGFEETGSRWQSELSGAP